MSAGLIGIDSQRFLLERLRRIGYSDHSDLEHLTQRLRSEFVETGPPHEQGYWLAQWLRATLGLGPDACASPADIIQTWGVQLDEIEIPERSVEAICAWGPRHGPIILLIRAADRSSDYLAVSSEYRRRSTLAHEICHLLIDRDHALPVAEVLGGRTPEHAEKRARAFAAEFLLPRQAAAAGVREAPGLSQAIDYLQQRFQVGLELTRWQIENSDAYPPLTAEEQALLEDIRRRGE